MTFPRLLRSLAITLLALLLSACPQWWVGGSSSTQTPPPAGSVSLQGFASPSELEAFIEAGLRNQSSSQYYREVMLNDGAVAPNSTTTAVPSTSTTNLQELGVDEADRIKSDGDFLYLLRSGSYLVENSGFMDVATELGPQTQAALRVLRLDENPPAATAIAELPWPEGQGEPEGLYLHKGEIAILASDHGGYYPVWHLSASWREGRSWVQWVDAANPTAPELARTLAFDGHLVGSRRIDDRLYLALRYTPRLPEPLPLTEAELERVLADTTLTDLLPDWYQNGISQGDLLVPSRCYRIPSAEQARSPDLVSLVVVDLANPTAQPEAHCLAGPSETLYVSPDSLWLAATRHPYSLGTDGLLRYQPEAATDLHKFVINPDGLVYRGSLVLEGHLGWEQDKKSLRMGEHEGVLRVALSLGAQWDGSSTTRLYTVSEASEGGLVELARLPNAARPAPIGLPGERLYAARFLADRGYLVTFRLTDPLYVVDLADPTDPRLAGELKITGYSDYLHPVSESLLLGIGKEAIVDSSDGDGRGAWYQGIKLSLFDVSNPANPELADSLVVGKRGSHSDLLYDHHALAWVPPDPDTARPGRLALPLRLHAGVQDPYCAGEPWCSYPWLHTGLYLFELDVASASLTQHGKLVVEAAIPEQPYAWYDGHDRALIDGAAVHYIHNGKVWSGDWASGQLSRGAQ